MALSNLFKEPRREITETLVGFVVITPFIVLDVWGARWLQALQPHNARPFLIIMVLVALMMFVAFALSMLALLGIHTVGEKACNALARRGINLRPKERYR